MPSSRAFCCFGSRVGGGARATVQSEHKSKAISYRQSTRCGFLRAIGFWRAVTPVPGQCGSPSLRRPGRLRQVPAKLPGAAAYAGTPPLRLTAGTYDVYNRGYNGAQLTPLGWATISIIGNGPDPDYQVTNPNSTYVLRPGQPIQEGRVFLNIRYKKPPNSGSWTQLNPPQSIRYVRRFAVPPSTMSITKIM